MQPSPITFITKNGAVRRSVPKCARGIEGLYHAYVTDTGELIIYPDHLIYQGVYCGLEFEGFDPENRCIHYWSGGLEKPVVCF